MKSMAASASILLVFIALCVLTSASFFTYSSYWPFKDQKQVTWAFMMAVSCTKAMLVIMFFMHLLWEANWKWVLTIPASFMSIFLLLMLVPDVGMRQNNGYARYSRERWMYAADPRWCMLRIRRRSMIKSSARVSFTRYAPEKPQ